MAALFLEDVFVGLELPEIVKGPMTVAHVMRWSAATENWHRIHYDWHYATEHDGLPDVVINGSWRQHVLVQLVNDWVRPKGWLWKIKFQFRGINVPGETLTAWGRVTEVERRGAYGVARLELGLRNQASVDGTPGDATVALARRDGPELPYPFDPNALAPPIT